jgi:sec-independent protein translocase protein TatA
MSTSLLLLSHLLLFSAPGGTEWLIILVVILLLFGGRKLPELFRGLGKGMREFKDAKDGKENLSESDNRTSDKEISSDGR